MATAEEVVARMTSLVDEANAVTGQNDGTVADAMRTLAAGYGAGGGEEIAESIVTGEITEYRNNRITSIRTRAFYQCRNLKVLDCPNVTTAGDDAVRNPDNLEVINLPKLAECGSYLVQGAVYNLESIDFPLLVSAGVGLCQDCLKLARVHLPLLSNVHNNSFANCRALEFIDLPSATRLGSSVFRATKLTTLILRRADDICVLANVDGFASSPFAVGGTGGTVYVPAALIESYQTATNWSTLYAAGTCNFVAIEGSEYE